VAVQEKTTPDMTFPFVSFACAENWTVRPAVVVAGDGVTEIVARTGGGEPLPWPHLAAAAGAAGAGTGAELGVELLTATAGSEGEELCAGHAERRAHARSALAIL
jgi:hypothetical protein